MDDDGKNAIKSYQQLDVDPTTLLSMEVLTADCKVNDSIFDHLRNAVSWIPVLGGFVENTRYVFAFNWLASAIVGIVFLIILIGFTIDIAVRSIKLAVLRLLAPIPIISYIEPKSSKDGGMFSSWVKALTSTYLDLFLRLAIVYFVIFLIQDMIANGIIINETGGLVGGFSIIFIMLGLFFFAKMAPKFIKDALGLKGSMSNIGLSGILAGAGAIRQGGTIFEAGEAMNDATRAQVQAYNHGKQAPELGESWNSGRDYAAKILTGDQNMSGRRMSRGAHHLKRMGITTPYAEGLKNQMYDAQDFAAQTKDQYDRYNEGKLTGNERAILQNELDGAITNYENQGYDRREAFRRALQDRMFTAQADAGKAKSKYEKVEGMQKQYGQARSYEAQFEGEDGRYMARNFTNRALGGLGRDSQTSRVQQWRTQKYPGAEATSSTNPTGAGVDMNPVGGMGEHTHDNE